MKLRNRGTRPHVSRSPKKRRTIPKSTTSKLDRIEDKLFRDEDFKQQCTDHATHALCFLRSHKNLDYELVKPGLVGGSGISQWFIFHINFKAKLRGCPDAPVQTFFAQLRFSAILSPDRKMVVDCCENLGPTDQLPEKVYSAGCDYCDDFLVHHPIGGCDKLLLGCENDDDNWLYGDSDSKDPE